MFLFIFYKIQLFLIFTFSMRFSRHKKKKNKTYNSNSVFWLGSYESEIENVECYIFYWFQLSKEIRTETRGGMLYTTWKRKMYFSSFYVYLEFYMMQHHIAIHFISMVSQYWNGNVVINDSGMMSMR